MTDPPPELPCPCCGYRTLFEPWTYDLCPVCHWEDDYNQLRWPDSAGGANGVTLIVEQRRFLRLEAADVFYGNRVRAPRADEPRDDGWRPIDLEHDRFEPTGVKLRDWPEDHPHLYLVAPDLLEARRRPSLTSSLADPRPEVVPVEGYCVGRVRSTTTQVPLASSIQGSARADQRSSAPSLHSRPAGSRPSCETDRDGRSNEADARS